MPDEDAKENQNVTSILYALNRNRTPEDDLGRNMRLGYWHSFFYRRNMESNMRILQQRGFKWKIPYSDDSSNIKSSINFVGKE